jgi:plastocyanin domain-containing protein
MVIMGVNMLGIFPWLRKFQPRLPRALSSLINREKGRSNSPLIVGLLNGLMPCGPLQAMQLYALSTGSPFRGAVSMLLFSLGTVPLMFGLGALSSLLSKKFTRKVMTAGAVLVTVLGLTMFSQGFALSGFAGLSFTEGAATESVIVDGVQFVSSTLASGAYPKITVQAGIPVKWTIDAPKGSINGCNNRLQIPEYGLEYKFQTGENIIEFTPTETGKIPYSCWMGMIRSSITVVEAGAETPPATVPANVSIPTDNVAVAELITAPDGSNATSQEVTIALTDDGYSPAIVVVQADVETAWVIDVDSTADSNFSFLVPIYGVYEELNLGENGFYLFPSESFEFSNGDNSFYGYVAVVEDLETADTDAIRREVSAFQTLIYPPDTFLNNGAVPSCHRPQDGEEY